MFLYWETSTGLSLITNIGTFFWHAQAIVEATFNISAMHEYSVHLLSDQKFEAFPVILQWVSVTRGGK